ncbi:MAG: hypothetical protein O7E52_10570 [Candidatus Poribacteria bacterium]|nr:hypothetical protein [Candidatus Poribacteria bacterium]
MEARQRNICHTFPLLPFHPFRPLSVCFAVLSVLSLVYFDSVFAQEAIRIRSHEFVPAHITVGDAVQLRLRIEADAHLHIYLDPIDLSDLQHVEMDAPQVKRIKLEKPGTDKVLYEVIYSLQAFAPGTHTLPPITIKYTGTDANDASIQTPAYSFEVTSVKLADATEMKGIKSPVSPPQRLLPYILAALLMTTVIGVLILLYLRKRAKTADLAPEVSRQRAPHEIAHEQLNRIEGMNLVAQGKMKVYHTEISQVIREYITARYNIPALELTTEDLLARLSHEAHLDLLRNFFANCDLVKFARYHPTKPEAHARMDDGRQIVDGTRQLWQEKHAEDEEAAR